LEVEPSSTNSAKQANTGFDGDNSDRSTSKVDRGFPEDEQIQYTKGKFRMLSPRIAVCPLNNYLT
jgi:hypothetical protein